MAWPGVTYPPSVRSLVGIRPHTNQVGLEITKRWPIFYVWGIGAAGHHKAGRAIDFMTLSADQSSLRTAVGNEIAAYGRTHHARLGIEYIIWRQRIWNATRSDDRTRVAWSTWRAMADRGSITANHGDHNHWSLIDRPPAYRPLHVPAPPIEEEDEMRILAKIEGTPHSYALHANGTATWVPSPTVLNQLKAAGWRHIGVVAKEVEKTYKLLNGPLA